MISGLSLSMYRMGFTIFGVKVGIETNRKYFFDEIKKALPILFPFKIVESEFERSLVKLSLKHVGNENFRVKVTGEKPYLATDREFVLQYFLSFLRVKVAEHAKSRVFLHAGVVGFNGNAILIPAKSFKGKTTLVAELVKQGGEYYSDEYAVLDENGFVHPYPKMISLRGIIDKYIQKDFPPEEFGTVGVMPIPVGMVLFTEFEADAEWDPEELNSAQGMMEILPHTVPIRNKPKFSLFVLNKVLSRARITKCKRGEASQFAKLLIRYFEKHQNLDLS